MRDLEKAEKIAETAAEYKRNGVCNCCQAVLKAYSASSFSGDNSFGKKLGNMSEQTLLDMAAGFAAGMGCMESTCGAVIGACMAAGIMTDGKGTVKLARDIMDRFAQKSGATICKDLKGIETGKVLCPCDKCVYNAVMALEESL